MARFLVWALGVWVCVVSPVVAAQQDVSARQRRLQDDLATQRAVAIARERRLADGREERLLEELAQRDVRWRGALRDARLSEERRVAARAELDVVIAERASLVTALSQRDRSYAAEVAEYRTQISGLTATTNHELQQALERYADGDRVGAYPVIEQIRRAEQRAVERVAQMRKAAIERELVALLTDMRERGERTTADVLARLGARAGTGR